MVHKQPWEGKVFYDMDEGDIDQWMRYQGAVHVVLRKKCTLTHLLMFNDGRVVCKCCGWKIKWGNMGKDGFSGPYRMGRIEGRGVY